MRMIESILYQYGHVGGIVEDKWVGICGGTVEGTRRGRLLKRMTAAVSYCIVWAIGISDTTGITRDHRHWSVFV